MSLQLREFLGSRFGSTDGADCCVCFYTASEESRPQGACPSFIGAPLPAHQLVLRGGSERFRAHIERWAPPRSDSVTDSAPGVEREHVFVSLSLDTSTENMGECPHVRVELIVLGSSGGSASGKAPAVVCLSSGAINPAVPILLVPLESEEELQPSLDAIRFIYTGSLAAQAQQQVGQGRQDEARTEHLRGQGAEGGGGVSYSMNQLVRIRRQAEYLQVQGCADACDAALVECFKPAGGGGSSTTTTTSSSPALPLAPVLELYSCRHLLPSQGEDARVGNVLSACRRYLLRHWVHQQRSGELGGSEPPTNAEVLAWLIGPGGAVRIANDVQLHLLWHALPVGILEELLQSDHLSTDDEATVVLLVEMWVAAKGSAITEADKTRVRRQLRLVNCSTSYLFDVLPRLPWIGAQEATFMARCRFHKRPHWQQHGGACGGHDTSSPWYGQPRPQSVPVEGVSYRWEISREDLLAGLRGGGADAKWMSAKILLGDGGGSYSTHVSLLVAGGFEWGVRVEHKPGAANAGLYLFCNVPAAIMAQTGTLQGGGGIVSIGLTVVGSSQEVFRRTFNSELVRYGRGWGWSSVLPFVARSQQEGQAGGEHGDAALLAPWAKLLGPEGKIRGVLTFYRLAEGQE